MTNKAIAEAFASGKTKGKALHMFIEGNTIYSYGRHFPIATRVGTTKVLFTSKGYSVTTARHKGLVKRALLNKGLDVVETDQSDGYHLRYP